MDRNLRGYLAELIGSFILVFLSAGVICTNKLAETSGLQQPYLVGIALTQGFALAIALSATVHAGGGYLNPAFTLMLWVFKRLEGPRAIGLIVAQVIGAVLAGLVIRVTFDEKVLGPAKLGAPHLVREFFGGQADVQPNLKMLASGIGIELVLTFIVSFAIFATMIDPRAPKFGGLGAGLAMSACVFVGFDLTGASVNPARWFGTLIWEATVQSQGIWQDHAVYWIGPILGALLAGGVYTTLILPPEIDK